MAVDIDEITRWVPGPMPDSSHIELSGPLTVAASAFDVDGILAASYAYAQAALDATASERGLPVPERNLELGRLLATCANHVELNGAAVPAWAELSGVYAAAGDRQIQLHANFPHHAAGVVECLGCSHDRRSVASAIAERDAFELEAEWIEAGMIGAALRTPQEWEKHPHAVATAGLPLVSVESIGEAPPVQPMPRAANRSLGPLAGDRVLDSSRVLAGPAAGQVLARSGADVVRVGADHLPSVPICVMSTGFGKRNVSLDLRTEGGLSGMKHLLSSADAWIDAYRPGAMGALGLSPERVAELRPGIVMVQVSAFDWVGPWAGRRGFDSIVQSTTGLRVAGGQHAMDGEGQPLGDGPRGLPVQALDYATGFLAAGLAAQLMVHQRRSGGSWLARVSLLRVRDWLVARRPAQAYRPAAVPVEDALLHSVESSFGRLRTVRPVFGAIGSAPRSLGGDRPEWLPRA